MAKLDCWRSGGLLWDDHALSSFVGCVCDCGWRVISADSVDLFSLVAEISGAGRWLSTRWDNNYIGGICRPRIEASLYLDLAFQPQRYLPSCADGGHRVLLFGHPIKGPIYSVAGSHSSLMVPAATNMSRSRSIYFRMAPLT